jgi:hypothetical protein
MDGLQWELVETTSTPWKIDNTVVDTGGKLFFPFIKILPTSPCMGKTVESIASFRIIV